MEHLDEHEMLIEYSEMSAFDFNSEEFRRVRKDYLECKGFLDNLMMNILKIAENLKPAKSF
jgi:hypothetical protein